MLCMERSDLFDISMNALPAYSATIETFMPKSFTKNINFVKRLLLMPSSSLPISMGPFQLSGSFYRKTTFQPYTFSDEQCENGARLIEYKIHLNDEKNQRTHGQKHPSKKSQAFVHG